MTLCQYDRDDPKYPWHNRPADHSVAGLFIGGPQEAGGCLARLIAPSICPVSAPSPAVALAQMTIKRQRVRKAATGLQKLLAQLEGRHTRNRRVA